MSGPNFTDLHMKLRHPSQHRACCDTRLDIGSRLLSSGRPASLSPATERQHPEGVRADSRLAEPPFEPRRMSSAIGRPASRLLPRGSIPRGYQSMPDSPSLWSSVIIHGMVWQLPNQLCTLLISSFYQYYSVAMPALCSTV